MEQHIISSKNLDKDFLEHLFELATYFKKILEAIQLSNDRHNRIKNRRELLESSRIIGEPVSLLFSQPSTRTQLSFASAAINLGAGLIALNDINETMSLAKGESIADTAKMLDLNLTVAIIRHAEPNFIKELAKYCQKTILINAGNGKEDHPTQAMLDLFTIKEHFNRIDGLSFAIVGDLKDGRASNALCYALANYKIKKINFIAAKGLQVGNQIKDFLLEKNIYFEEVKNLYDIADEVDVFYATRVQFPKDHVSASNICIDKELLKKIKDNSIIMHPLPRNEEIHPDIDKDSRGVYFKQAANGLPIRMALLNSIFNIY